MAELHHECGVAAVYHLATDPLSELAVLGDRNQSSRYIPQILQDIQNRGQLAAGMTTWSPERKTQLLMTHKDVGMVSEVFDLSHRERHDKRMAEMAGPAAIGHVRYATCGKDDPNYAHPFERQHIEKPKWFSFVYNGQLANYQDLRKEILDHSDFHLSRETDTEVIMHLLCQELAGDRRPTMIELLRSLRGKMDGAYVLAYLNARGDMCVARDPLGIRPLCYAKEGALFAAASESVALSNMGFREESIQNLSPGHAICIEGGKFSISSFMDRPVSVSVPVTLSRHFQPQPTAHCFFEWIYFANVASTLDGTSVYLSRKRLGEALAALEDQPLDDDTIVVPVPDTAKAAADSMAYTLKLPCVEGLIRNRYMGRTFIEGPTGRADKVRRKYTPLPEVLEGKRVLLVEDTIVRSTTMRSLIRQIKIRGRAKEVHVRVACPPIVAPCFYGIDMSSVNELFAPAYLKSGGMTPEIERRMADDLGASSLRYLPIDSIAAAVGHPAEHLCQACLSSKYPTPCGGEMYQLALELSEHDRQGPAAGSADGARVQRTFDEPRAIVSPRL